MNNIRKIYSHISDENFKEVMATMTATDKYGGKIILLTREDLCVLYHVLMTEANARNSCGGESGLSSREIWDVQNKIMGLFTKGVM